MAKIGFIGMGNMGHAILKGALKEYPAEEMIFCAKTSETKTKVHAETGVEYTDNNAECANRCKYLVLAVKPQFYESVITEIKDKVTEDKIIITIAPGKTLAWLEEKFGKKVKIVRTMPNTPAMVMEGMTAASPNSYLSEEEVKYACHILESFGKVEVIPERLMDAVVGVSGSSPAYVFILIEAMADAAVSDGMPRAQAYKFAAQAVMGSAKMVLETGKHPGELKDMVCSPAGTTIEAVRVLEGTGFRSSVIEAMKACTDIAKGM